MDSVETLVVELSSDAAKKRSSNKSYVYETFKTYTYEEDRLHEMGSDVQTVFNEIVKAAMDSEDLNFEFAYESLMRWPHLSYLPLNLEIDVLNTILYHDSYLGVCSLGQMLVYCEPLKLKFLERIEEFLRIQPKFTVGHLCQIEDCGQFFGSMLKNTVYKVYDLLFTLNVEGQAKVVDYLRRHIKMLNIDTKTIYECLTDNSKRDVMAPLVMEMARHENRFQYFNILVNCNCIKEACRLIRYTEFKREPLMYSMLVNCLIRLGPDNTNEVAYCFCQLQLSFDELKPYMEIENRFFLLPALARFTTEPLASAYIKQCIATDIDQSFDVIYNTYCDFQHQYLPFFLDYIGEKPEVNHFFYLNRASEIPEIENNKTRIILKCIEKVESKYCLEIIDALIDWRYTELDLFVGLWPKLVLMEGSSIRTGLMMLFGKLEEYKPLMFEHYHEFVPYLSEVFYLLHTLPPTLGIHSINTLMDKKDTVLKRCYSPWSPKFIKLHRWFADYAIECNDFESLWTIADSMKSEYAQRLAWKYTIDCNDERQVKCVIESLIQNGMALVPSDEVANEALIHLYTKSKILSSDMAIIADFIYKNTNVKIHFGLFRRLIKSGVDFSSFFYAMINTHQYKNKEFIPILIEMFLSSKTFTHKEFELITNIDNSEEAQILVNSLSQQQPIFSLKRSRGY